MARFFKAKNHSYILVESITAIHRNGRFIYFHRVDGDTLHWKFGTSEFASLVFESLKEYEIEL